MIPRYLCTGWKDINAIEQTQIKCHRRRKKQCKLTRKVRLEFLEEVRWNRPWGCVDLGRGFQDGEQHEQWAEVEKRKVCLRNCTFSLMRDEKESGEWKLGRGAILWGGMTLNSRPGSFHLVVGNWWRIFKNESYLILMPLEDISLTAMCRMNIPGSA